MTIFFLVKLKKASAISLVFFSTAGERMIVEDFFVKLANLSLLLLGVRYSTPK